MKDQLIKDKTKSIQQSLNRPIFFLFPALIGLAIAAFVFSRYQVKYDVIHTNEKIQMLSALSDSFFISGVFVGGVGLLVLVSGEGFFDIITYSVGKMMSYIFIPRETRKHETYADYKLRKEGEREGGKIWFIAAVGMVFVVIALLTSIPFWNLSTKKIEKGYSKAISTYVEDNNLTENDYIVTDVEYYYVKYYKEDPTLEGTVIYKITINQQEGESEIII